MKESGICTESTARSIPWHHGWTHLFLRSQFPREPFGPLASGPPWAPAAAGTPSLPLMFSDLAGQRNLCCNGLRAASDNWAHRQTSDCSAPQLPKQYPCSALGMSGHWREWGGVPLITVPSPAAAVYGHHTHWTIALYFLCSTTPKVMHLLSRWDEDSRISQLPWDVSLLHLQANIFNIFLTSPIEVTFMRAMPRP